MDEQGPATGGQTVAVVAPATASSPEPAPPRRRNVRGTFGMATALVLAFVWGGIADRELSSPRTVARITTAAAAVEGAEAPPQWISDFASAFCTGEPQLLAARIGPPLTNNVDAIANALHDRDWTCSNIRFAGAGASPKADFYVFITTDGARMQQWWVFTVIGQQVIAID